MGAVLHPSRGGLYTTLALDAGVIPKIEGELLTTATDILERREVISKPPVSTRFSVYLREQYVSAAIRSRRERTYENLPPYSAATVSDAGG
jgi:hypothetical protein